MERDIRGKKIKREELTSVKQLSSSDNKDRCKKCSAFFMRDMLVATAIRLLPVCSNNQYS
ncbi:unnamed protein product [Dovyalis caffra]|uniref:Uncharacterized protein n=1 Tax=Dovyalis caffra TaxID=77055 RepID=A0AAV1R025_9ROSI|nr:unnamed protein product [Dovyalis caffra]